MAVVVQYNSAIQSTYHYRAILGYWDLDQKYNNNYKYTHYNDSMITLSESDITWSDIIWVDISLGGNSYGHLKRVNNSVLTLSVTNFLGVVWL